MRAKLLQDVPNLGKCGDVIGCNDHKLDELTAKGQAVAVADEVVAKPETPKGKTGGKPTGRNPK